MKPRVFVSSTYYDLKYLRERIEKFLLIYGFDTVLFESNNVTYEHGKPIDLSVYKELEMCHMMILIVGGRYGSAISSEKVSVEDRKRYDEEYVSITRKEFDTACERNIPIFIFIDKNVFSDYENYNRNVAFLDKIKLLDNKETFQFVHVDSVNVFKFINTLISKPVKTFEKAEEIETYLQNQLAGMFYLYLESLQNQVNEKRILNSVEELNSVTRLMSEMLDSVGKKILGEGNKEYEDVIDKQFELLLDYFIESLNDNIKIVEFGQSLEVNGITNLKFVAQQIFRLVFKEEYVFPEIKSSEKRNLFFEKDISIKNELNALIEKDYPSTKIEHINAVLLNKNFFKNVKPFVKDQADFEGKLIQDITNSLFWILL